MKHWSIGLFITYTALTVNVFAQQKALKYLPIGDSYTIGEGIARDSTWPSLLTKHLNWSGISIEMITNPAVTGYTTQNAIDTELPLVKKYKPDFVTLMLGVNDYVQRKSIEDFKKNLKYLLDEIQASITNKEAIILLTIPDYSVTPEGQRYVKGRNVSSDLLEWNAAIVAEAKSRKLPCIDVYEATHAMGKQSHLVASDGLHPSASEHKIWELLLFKDTYEQLQRLYK